MKKTATATTTNDNSNKRKHPRKSSRLLVQLYGKDFQIYTNAVNIGAGGAFINTLYLLTEGTPLSLKLQLPDSDQTIDLKGRVVRQVTESSELPTMDHIGMAIQFTELNADSEKLITQMVAR